MNTCDIAKGQCNERASWKALTYMHVVWLLKGEEKYL